MEETWTERLVFIWIEGEGEKGGDYIPRLKNGTLQFMMNTGLIIIIVKHVSRDVPAISPRLALIG